MREKPIDLTLDQQWKISDGQTLSTHEIFTKLQSKSINKMLVCENDDYEEETLKQRFKIVDDYGVLQALGQGTFGKVYRCYHVKQSSDNYAIKIPNQDIIDTYKREGISLGQMFSEEAVGVARLSVCPNVVSVIDHSTEYPYIVLEYCDGGTLAKKLKTNYTVKQIYEWASQISYALSVAHELRPKSLIHRDLKPENILLAGGLLKIADFGDTKMRGATSKSLLTSRGGYTPLFASPETFDGKFNTGVDIWSLGVILYQCISGTLPFLASDINHLISKIKNENFIPLYSNKKFLIDEETAKIVELCLNKDWKKDLMQKKLTTFLCTK